MNQGQTRKSVGIRFLTKTLIFCSFDCFSFDNSSCEHFYEMMPFSLALVSEIFPCMTYASVAFYTKEVYSLFGTISETCLLAWQDIYYELKS